MFNKTNSQKISILTGGATIIPRGAGEKSFFTPLSLMSKEERVELVAMNDKGGYC
jgi:hypothetical protein